MALHSRELLLFFVLFFSQPDQFTYCFFRYRCLDLRRHQMNSNIMLRHRVVKLVRRYLEDALGFVEVLSCFHCPIYTFSIFCIVIISFSLIFILYIQGRLRPQCFLGLPQRVLGIIQCLQEFRYWLVVCLLFFIFCLLDISLGLVQNLYSEQLVKYDL